MRIQVGQLLIAACALVIFTGAQDISECLENPKICGENIQCRNTLGGYKCVCHSGYQTNKNKTEFCHNEKNNTCEDINECLENKNICGANAHCNNTVGEYKCVCHSGYQTKGNKTEFCHNETYTKCEDINECDRNTHKCGANTKCKNRIGSYLCQCEPGYLMENFSTEFTPTDNKGHIKCEDINECQENPIICGANAQCKNTQGGYKCVCDSGYQTKGNKTEFCHNETYTKCEDINKCQENPNICGANAECKNTDSSCILQRSSYHLLESFCQNNKTKLDIKNLTNSASGILSDPSWSNLSSSKVSTVVTGLLETVELSVLNLFSKNPSNWNFSTPELDGATKVSHKNCSFVTINVGLNSMQVSCELLPKPEDGAAFISYKNLNSRLSGSFLKLSEDPEDSSTAVVNSQVVTGSITSQTRERLKYPVTLYLNNLQAPDSSQISVCVFWDPKLSGWSQRGCNITLSNVSHTLCSCDHLSTFAVIMAPCHIKEDHGLHHISRIGLSVSLLCLFLSLVTFLLCRSLRSTHTSMLIALCGCLFLGQLIILFGLQQTRFTILCSVIAGCLHFILLSAFCWMTLESVLLFLTVRNLEAMNYLTSQRSHFPTACFIGFGVPAVIVAISAAVRSEGYGTGKSCWLNLSVIWSFLGPVCVFITINTTLLILTIRLLRVKLASLNKNVSSLKNTRLLTFKALAQLFILGSTWVLGFFQCGTGAIVASYLFTICNSLQGAFIFLVHCLLNLQVREEYRKSFRRLHVKKPESEGLSGSTVPLTLKSASVYEVLKPEVSKTDWCKPLNEDTNY
ncbi:adhesion G protein-coupled receptor E1 [Xenopus laevis]|uniref:Adhesion G protein-coupled receptor E1 n=1 Tax=Xenopus laevis TaxID=8355 RepID=A0A8J1MQP5_XENLA|nr:adhesion G protein-coupled receptor E1 [Xenopus laevis]